MVDGAADEDAVGEFGDLHGGDGLVMAGVAERAVEGEELLKAVVDIRMRREN